MQSRISITPVLQYTRTRVEEIYGARFVELQLFGSHARNEAREDSDIDLLLVLDGEVARYEENWKLSDVVLEVMRRFDQVVSFVVVSSYELEHADWPLLDGIKDETISV